MADHHTTGAIAVKALQVDPGAMVLRLVDTGVQAELIGQGPVDGGAVLQFFANLPRRQPENHPRVHQVVDRDPCRGAATGLLIPVAEQFAFFPGKQVVAPAFIEVAPVVGLVHQLLGGGCDLAVFDQAHFHFVDPAWQWTGVEGL
ncbi:hypothetical protein D3C76_1355730 [compost metagenome]